MPAVSVFTYSQVGPQSLKMKTSDSGVLIDAQLYFSTLFSIPYLATTNTAIATVQLLGDHHFRPQQLRADCFLVQLYIVFRQLRAEGKVGRPWVLSRSLASRRKAFAAFSPSERRGSGKQAAGRRRRYDRAT